MCVCVCVCVCVGVGVAVLGTGGVVLCLFYGSCMVLFRRLEFALGRDLLTWLCCSVQDIAAMFPTL